MNHHISITPTRYAAGWAFFCAFLAAPLPRPVQIPNRNLNGENTDAVTINYNGQMASVAVTVEVYEFLDRADQEENLAHIKALQEQLGHASASFPLDVHGPVTEKMLQKSAAGMEQSS